MAPVTAKPRRCRFVPKAVAATAPAASGPIILDGQVLHSITSERLELIQGMGDYVENNVCSQACLGFQRLR